MPVSQIFNCIELSDGTALAGMPTAKQCRELPGEGFKAVINLAPETSEDALAGEAELLDAMGIEYHNIPVEWDRPLREDFDRFAEILASLKGKRTLIHCMANFRVTAFYAAYAFRNLGWRGQEAQKLIDRIWMSRPDYTMDETWRSFIAARMAGT